MHISSSLTWRCISGFALAPIVILALWFGWPIYVLVLFGVCVAVYEWLNLTNKLPFGTFIGIGGILYIIACAVCFILVQTYGIIFPIVLVFCVWASDVGAYMAGKLIGGPKLLPSVSPNKTWVGLIGGMIACVIMLEGFDWYFDLFSSFVISLLVAVFITLAGQLGDLIVSIFKRRADVKDTGNLIPGHGGLLDRIDSLLLASPLFLFCVKVFIG